MDLKEERTFLKSVSDHWYYRSKADAMRKYLGNISPKQIIDVGAGSGFFSKHLLARTNAEKAICVDIKYIEEKDEIFASKIIQFRKYSENVNVDLVLLMDVIEHVDDDMGFLKEQISKVPTGTFFVITVPAFLFLWSKHDEFLEHKRRYTLGQLESLVCEAGLCIVRGSYYFGFIFPLVSAVRLFGRWKSSSEHRLKSDLKQYSRIANGILSFICRLELFFLPYNRIAGLSVFCLARKITDSQEVSLDGSVR